MFTGEDATAHQYCQREILCNYTSPTLYPGPKGEFWVYSFHTTILTTWQCNYPNEIPRTITRTLKGTGIMYNTKDCHIYSKYFAIFPHSSGKTSMKIQFNHIVVPAITDILSPTERSLFKNPTTDSLNNGISDLEQILNENTARADVVTIEELQRKLTEIRQTKAENNSVFLTYLTVILIVILITSCLIISCVLKCIYTCRTQQNTQSDDDADREPARAMPTALHVYLSLIHI